MKSSGAHFGCRVLFHDKDNQIIAHYRSLKKVDPLARIEQCVKKCAIHNLRLENRKS